MLRANGQNDHPNSNSGRFFFVEQKFLHFEVSLEYFCWSTKYSPQEFLVAALGLPPPCRAPDEKTIGVMEACAIKTLRRNYRISIITAEHKRAISPVKFPRADWR